MSFPFFVCICIFFYSFSFVTLHLSFNLPSSFPSLIFALFLFYFSLCNDIFSKVFHFCINFLLLLLCYSAYFVLSSSLSTRFFYDFIFLIQLFFLVSIFVCFHFVFFSYCTSTFSFSLFPLHFLFIISSFLYYYFSFFL